MQIKSVEFLREPKRLSIQQLMGFASEKKKSKNFLRAMVARFLSYTKTKAVEPTLVHRI